ncbi:divergent PAP2 family protein [Schinkia azotoformans]|uniref:divergent PAP2 family protein n=1 Tax=Schinkia azotoformans TaxID=1454 RepID=UPI002DBD445F|nr:divergent PAP2 family protein [Schinkia azotoformans]MEC1718036.1 divergent PAP2 family protein [Schinkia azotoformans]MEC1746886.1 divergent PAP2 family protein [Schinkia azotoformans]MEC1760379.1 divergent PAP2 family protein [Schinkia azotoformans]MEC1773438.1 divergent PAP2 family protein [Schinkia azotoformans]MED4367974.1 divergent PAP2 family protein [Schinkia azotoformans]
MNRGIATALLSIGLAQFLKIPIQKVRTGKWDWGVFFETGGMPSSHSAGVSSLATFIALKRGISTIDFALSTIFGLIVMYDAQGVRRQTGELSIRVNDLYEDLDRLEKQQKRAELHEEKEEKIKEVLGHQPQEVLGGALLGVATGALSYRISKK